MENRYTAAIVALVGIILIGLGTFYLKTSGDQGIVEVQVLGANKLAEDRNSDIKININEASQTELEELPGIGPARALGIIQGRPYGEVKDLLVKKIVGRSVYEQISALVSVK